MTSLARRNPIAAYMHWLHTRWPAGTVEKLPLVNPDGTTNVPGLYIVGDLTGIPLLKFSADTGAKAVFSILKDPAFVKRDRSDDGVLDLAIIGGGVSGFSAAIEANKAGLGFKLFEGSEAFSTIVNFPKGKPIYTYPTDMTPAGDLQFHEKSEVKEGLLEDLHEQVSAAGIEPTFGRVDRVRRKGGLLELDMGRGAEPVRAHRVIVAIGRSGNFRKLGVPGEDLDKVYNRLHDPKDYCSQNVVVVGGGDSAMETAIALATCGANVTLSYRKPEFSRPKPENIEMINALAANPEADVAVEHPSSERITTAADPSMRPPGAKGSLTLMMASKPKAITPADMTITDRDGNDQTLPNDAVFTMIGREAPLDFFRKSGVKISGEMTGKAFLGLVAFLAFMTWIYHWKSNKPLPFMGDTPPWLTSDLNAMWGWVASLGTWWQSQVADPATLLGTLAISASGGAFFYTLAYSVIVVVFGIRRVRRRKTPYVKLQTTVLAAIQVVPLFLLPEIILPLMGHNGLLGGRQTVAYVSPEELSDLQALEQQLANGEIDPVSAAAQLDPDVFPEIVNEGGSPSLSVQGPGLQFTEDGVVTVAVDTQTGRYYLTDLGKSKAAVTDGLFPEAQYGNGREYWRAYGFILAWPLMVWNIFTNDPLWWWIAIGFAQTFVIIPLLIWRYGKGAYCGWICSCGALAETLGDAHRHKMPHGPFWNRLNMVGQVFLLFALVLLVLRIVGWIWPGSVAGEVYNAGLNGKIPQDVWWGFLAYPLMVFKYEWMVDVLWAGIIGYGVYFWYSGRFWCRFACPLAALMHIYARFSQFRILADKKKCISCNVCTSVCHQGIDIMNFANKGMPMEDPECVRCSACVQSCPTGVLTFGRINPKTGEVLGVDSLAASPVQMAEVKLTVNGH